MTTSNQPFFWMERDEVLACGPFKSPSQLAAKVKAGQYAAPYHVSNRALWRSDEVAAANAKIAAEATAEREELAKRARELGQGLFRARMEIKQRREAEKKAGDEAAAALKDAA